MKSAREEDDLVATHEINVTPFIDAIASGPT
jgi:biopolymer transport protein ExbD